MANEWVKKGALWGIAFLCALIGLVLLLNLLDSTTPNALSVNEEQRLEMRDGKLIVPADRIPQNFDERVDAPAISLLPGHSATEVEAAPVSTGQQNSLEESVTGFLKSWETFSPRATGAAIAANKPDPYQSSLQPYVDSDSLSDVINRVDSIDPTGVCPVCTLGSQWVESDIGSSLTVNDYDGTQAYVTVNGLVEYTGDQQFNSLAGSTYFRSYGLILRRQGDSWLITRAVGESEGPVA